MSKEYNIGIYSVGAAGGEAEMVRDLGDVFTTMLPWFNQAVSDDVGINNRHPQFGKRIGDKGFTRGNAASQRNSVRVVLVFRCRVLAHEQIRGFPGRYLLNRRR